MSTLSAIWANYAPHVGVFAVIALAPLIVAVFGYAAVGANATVVYDGTRSQANVADTGRRDATVAMVCIIAVALLYGFVMGSGDDLVGIDYAQLTAHRFADIPILPTTGRFFPLAFQEYTLLDLIGRSATVYYSFVALELVVILVLTHRLFGDAPAVVVTLGIAWLLSSSGFAACFRGLIYPERDLILCLVAWLVCHRRAMRTRHFWPALGALAAAEYALYLKETTFLLVGGFAIAHMLISWRQSPAGARMSERLRSVVATYWLTLGLVALSCTFLVQYAIVILPHAPPATVGHSGVYATAAAFLADNAFLGLLAIVVVGRVASALSGKASLDPFWDSVAIGAVLCILGYIRLGMYRDYYAAPAQLLAVIYLGRLVPMSLRRRAPIAATASLVVSAAIVVNARVTAARLLDRKEFVAETRALVSELTPRLARDHAVTLFFPQYGGFQIMEFGAYLQYKGISVEGASEHAATVFKTPHRFPNDRCFVSQAIRCELASAPSAGDLIVLLPGREPPPELAHAAAAARHAREPAARPLVHRLLAYISAKDAQSPSTAAGAILAAGAGVGR